MTPLLPTPSPGLTLGAVSVAQARFDLDRRRVRFVIRAQDEIYTITGPRLLAEGYARRCKRAGWTYVTNSKGLTQ